MDSYDVVIIGMGPAGCSAAIYATRFGMKTLVIGKEPGGQANEAYEIDNYPGLFEVKGIELMNRFREQAKTLGAEMVFSEVVDIGKKDDAFVVKTESKEYEGKAVIIATGAKKRRLHIPGENELRGRGVSYCATCDAAFFKDRTVCVVGGGSAAVMTALMLTEHAKKVYLVYRKEKEEMRAMPAWIKKAERNKKIKMMFCISPKRILGREKVEAVVFDTGKKELRMKLDGIFVEIGADPQISLAKKLGVELTEKGEIKVDCDMQTNVKGAFAAGDVTSGSGGFEQIITAAAEGAIAAKSAYKYARKT